MHSPSFTSLLSGETEDTVRPHHGTPDIFTVSTNHDAHTKLVDDAAKAHGDGFILVVQPATEEDEMIVSGSLSSREDIVHTTGFGNPIQGVRIRSQDEVRQYLSMASIERTDFMFVVTAAISSAPRPITTGACSQ